MGARHVRWGAVGLLLLGTGGVQATSEPGRPAHQLPFEPAATNRIVVDLAPEGAAQRLPLILDTGATHSVMSPTVARRLGIPVRAAKRTPYRRSTRLGRDLSFFVDASTSDTDSGSSERHGLLGGNFLARFVLQLDFEGRRVGFLDPAPPIVQQAPDEVALPLRVVSDRPHLQIEVDGSPLRVLLDTGDPFGLSLLRGAARELGIASSRVSGMVVWGVLGPLRVELGEARKVVVGPFELEGVPVLVHEGGYNQGDASGAAIGVDLLAMFDVRIDYPRRRLWLRQHSSRTTLFGADYQRVRASGALLEPVPEEDDAIYVRWILPGSPAARLGLLPGDWLSPLVLKQEQLDLEGVHRRVESGGPLEVVREQGGGWVEVQLPTSLDP